MTKLLKRLDFVYKKPKCVPAKADAAVQERFAKQTLLALRCKTSRPTRMIPLISGFHSVLATAQAALNTSATLVSWRLRAVVIEVSLLVGWREVQAVAAFCSKVG
jgi:hypothetical protein